MYNMNFFRSEKIYHIHNSFFTEAITPLVLDTQKQFNFSHILAGATAFGKVMGFLIAEAGPILILKNPIVFWNFTF